ncbi:MAG: hypothetical protein CM1200mP30_08190 [Pseudomonadota bacterium]|nr:MAG: hypothetical protein CM1200mP30_08190 [Pseudomonadota bacterium]
MHQALTVHADSTCYVLVWSKCGRNVAVIIDYYNRTCCCLQSTVRYTRALQLTEVFELFIVLVIVRLTPSLPVAAEIVLTTIPLLIWRSILVDELKVDLTGKEFTGTVS